MKYIELANNTKFDIYQEFKELNTEIFNNDLNLDFPLKWSKLKNAMGRVSYTYRRGQPSETINITKLTLSTFFDVSVETLRDILIHEMVHVYFLQVLNSLEGHGREFLQTIAEINKKFPQYNVKRTEDVTDYNVETSVSFSQPLYFYILHRKNMRQLLIGVFRKLDNEKKSFRRNIDHAITSKRDIDRIEFGISNLVELQRFTISRTLNTSLNKGSFFILKDEIYLKLQQDIQGAIL